MGDKPAGSALLLKGFVLILCRQWSPWMLEMFHMFDIFAMLLHSFWLQNCRQSSKLLKRTMPMLQIQALDQILIGFKWSAFQCLWKKGNGLELNWRVAVLSNLSFTLHGDLHGSNGGDNPPRWFPRFCVPDVAPYDPTQETPETRDTLRLPSLPLGLGFYPDREEGTGSFGVAGGWSHKAWVFQSFKHRMPFFRKEMTSIGAPGIEKRKSFTQRMLFTSCTSFTSEDLALRSISPNQLETLNIEIYTSWERKCKWTWKTLLQNISSSGLFRLFDLLNFLKIIEIQGNTRCWKIGCFHWQTKCWKPSWCRCQSGKWCQISAG